MLLRQARLQGTRGGAWYRGLGSGSRVFRSVVVDGLILVVVIAVVVIFLLVCS